ncbi:uncharacterized protein LOC132564417 [Ylistrum balloti]|uniref:uncharacterized protein LOC132564417 n=1 Tax=Ylistrum balloti TaxID=509963 RepID=UPI0029058B61|nr:uncharacterized protein LOC132564417 [Ylistrum balloti]
MHLSIRALLIFYTCQWTGTSGSSLLRKAELSKLRELSEHYEHRQFNPHVGTTPPSPSPSPSPSPVAIHHWMSCPILKQLLRLYISGFPEVSKAIDSFNISEATINATLWRVVKTFEYIQNPFLTVDLLIEDIARMILEKRANCTITMYQRVFIYAMMKQMNVMMSSDDRTILNQVGEILARHYSSRLDVIVLVPQIILITHDTVYKEIVDSLLQLEFRYLTWFLSIFRTEAQDIFERNAYPTSDYLFNELMEAVNAGRRLFPEVWQCTSEASFVAVHQTVAEQLSDHFFKMLETGYVSAKVIGDINLLFRMPGNGLTTPLDMDDPQLDLVVKELEGLILNYASEVMNATASYGESLSTHGLTEPPEYLLGLLSPTEVADTWTLFTRAFGPTPSPTVQFAEVNYTDILSIGRQELSDLNDLMTSLLASNSTEPAIVIQLTNIISKKENFISRLEYQLSIP